MKTKISPPYYCQMAMCNPVNSGKVRLNIGDEKIPMKKRMKGIEVAKNDGKG